MDYVYVNGELYHHGVKGMKWGVRKDPYAARRARGHSGPGRYIGNKRKLAGYKKDLEYLDNGGHLSVGIGKKRQAAYDARDRKALERGIAKAEANIKKREDRQADRAVKKDMRNASKNRRTLSDAELNARIKRLEQEKRLRELTDSEINRGRSAVNNVLAESGKKVAKTVLAGATMYAVKYAITKEFDAKDAAAYIVPKPKTK